MRRERPACGGKKPSSEWFFSSPGWRRHCPSAAGRIPPSPPRKRDRTCGLFFVLHKRRKDEKGTTRLWREKNHPVNGFLVPRAGGGTAPVPPGESLLLRQLRAQHNVLCTRCFWGSFYNRYHQLTRAHKPERLVLVRSCVLVACITSSSTALLGLGSPSKQAL